MKIFKESYLLFIYLNKYYILFILKYSVQFSRSVVSTSLRPHELQHAGLPCPSATPVACSNSSPLNQWCHPTSHPPSSPSPGTPNPSQHQSLFLWVSSSHEMAKVLEFQFSISLSNEYSGLICFMMNWLDLLAVQGILKSLLPTSQLKSINSLALSFLYSPTLTSTHDYWKNHSLDQTDLC